LILLIFYAKHKTYVEEASESMRKTLFEMRTLGYTAGSAGGNGG